MLIERDSYPYVEEEELTPGPSHIIKKKKKLACDAWDQPGEWGMSPLL